MNGPRIISGTALIAAVICSPGLTNSLAAQARADAAFSANTKSREHRYRVDVRVRPLLFWISKSDIGDGRMTWRRGPDGAIGYELLVGSDPARTPRRINRWGYLREEWGPRGITVFGVMSRSDERSVADADRSTSVAGDRVHVFKALQQEVSGGAATLTMFDVRMQQDLTYADLEALLGAVPASPARTRAARIDGWNAPGFLAATAALLEQGRKALDHGPNAPRAARLYPYNGRLYELRLRSAERVPHVTAGGRGFGPAIRTRLEVHNLATGDDTPFTIVSGLTGDLTDVPLLISFRPRWWIEIECVLADPPSV